MIFGLGKKKERCPLCGKPLDENYSVLSYIAQDDEGCDVETEYAKICSKCADKLDEQDQLASIKVDDREDRKADADVDAEWEDVAGHFDASLDRKSR